MYNYNCSVLNNKELKKLINHGHPLVIVIKITYIDEKKKKRDMVHRETLFVKVADAMRAFARSFSFETRIYPLNAS